ncbi:hypothetical protein KSP24_06525 [Paenibacillus sp. AK121]|uniref:hypothetical protein n=1 Tax=Paenibacillus TaxID=44249 RepID=UPI001C24698A|nr:hypothetical protein [Paenibacillus sp. AK121]MBU9706584.1 hypothetical protein [Paenibacillus sp. AK121]MEE4566771.1 hypothetical protein [Paenibacillus polymyxa]
MNKFRKKPVVVEAYQTHEELIIQTLEGPLKASPRDWVITGISSELGKVREEVNVSKFEGEPLKTAKSIHVNLISSRKLTSRLKQALAADGSLFFVHLHAN